MIGKHVATFAGHRLFAQCACLAILAALMGTVEQAWGSDDDIVNTYGFETNPPNGPPAGFSTTFNGDGKLEGQVNPIGSGQFNSPGQWVRTLTGTGTSTAIVQSTVFAPGGGNQAVRYDRAPNSEVRWAVPVNALAYPDYDPNDPNPILPNGQPQQPCICITWDMSVLQTVSNTTGPFFGVEAYDNDNNPVATLGSLGVNSTTGEVVYQSAVTGPGVGGDFTNTGSFVTLGANNWNRFQIKLDYSTLQYTVYLNGNTLGTIGFVDEFNYPGQMYQLSDVDISGLSMAGDSVSMGLTGTAYFDNFLVREGMCIPEPNTLLLVASGLGLIASAGRRQRPVRV